MARILVLDENEKFACHLKNLLTRFGDEIVSIQSPENAVAAIASKEIDLIIVDEGFNAGKPLEAPIDEVLEHSYPPVMLITSEQSFTAIESSYNKAVECVVMKPYHHRELLSWIYALLQQQRRIVCLGGGTGLYTLLLGLKRLPNVHLTSIVSMSDDGGSTGRIREAFGVLPPGDVRRSLVALSTAPSLMNELMQYRFGQNEAGLKDHNVGNLLLTAVADLRGSMAEAVRSMGDILNIQGIVLPVTSTLNTLHAELMDGSIIKGEHHIDVPEGRDPQMRIRRVWQEPEPEANPDALTTLMAADVIVIGPGDLFTSVVSTLAVKGIAEAIRKSRARKIYVCNLMTKPGETSGFTAADHIREIVRYCDEDVLDDVLLANSPISDEAIWYYAKKDQDPVKVDPPEVLREVTKARIVLSDIGSEQERVRHDSNRLAKELAGIMDVGAPRIPARHRYRRY